MDETLGEDDGVLSIDGSDIPKRGTHSAGVARPWCGATGETDNGQAGVFLGYASRRGYTLPDRRLYLPKDRFGPVYRARWQACAIPAATTFHTKGQLATAMVAACQQEGRIRARWLTCDEWSGRDPVFLDGVAALGRCYLAEVARDTPVWPLVEPATLAPRDRPCRWIPPRAASGKGRRPSRERLHPASPPPLRLDDLAGQLPPGAWHRYRILEGRTGPLVADFAAPRAVATRDGLPGPEVWVLLRRPVPAAPDAEVKCYLCNAPAATPLGALVRVNGMRWPIESCFEEGEGGTGPGPLRAALLARLAPPHGAGHPGAPLPGPAPATPGAERGGPRRPHPRRRPRLLPRAVLPRPAFDIAAALDLLHYQQRRQAAASRAHRKPTLRRLDELRRHTVSLS